MTPTSRPITALRGWAAGRSRVLGAAGAVAALGMSTLWTVVVPDKADTTAGLQSLAIRWGHPVCWALLAGVGLAVALDAPRRVRDPLAWAALGSYAAFLLALAL
ncbi:hypothetical protein [Ornithinimicrobium tianjinense]|uniref:Uncharacterized protein n=1 Tax=Ornithinimicrobium tianjinense TaxID=1195761 RepID=A0A917F4Y1_9MICO|nr:hypothetical protein [Ornithinimicrobium tianjinense]GGF43567.1 hypothetical protein GCM10011366_09250 [Ornithinimicrobium tianjinense]